MSFGPEISIVYIVWYGPYVLAVLFGAVTFAAIVRYILKKRAKTVSRKAKKKGFSDWYLGLGLLKQTGLIFVVLALVVFVAFWAEAYTSDRLRERRWDECARQLGYVDRIEAMNDFSDPGNPQSKKNAYMSCAKY